MNKIECLRLLLILSSFADAYSFLPVRLKCRELKATLEHVAPQYVTSIDTSPWHGMDSPFQDAQWLMPSIMERALIYGDTSVDAFKLLEVLDMSTSEREVARNVLVRNDGIVTTPVLTKEECQKLRNFVQREIKNDGIDQVDGYPDWQVNMSEKKLIKIIGQQAKDRLWKVPGMLDDRATSFDSNKVGIFIRMYQKEERPWMPFHRDGNQWTVNVALNDSNEFKGGKLLALQNGQVEALERNEGDATCHNDSIFHAVTAVLEGIRYSMILFFHKDLS